MFGKDHAFLAETRRGQVGNVVCHDLHFAHQTGLAGERDITGVVHGQIPEMSGTIVSVKNVTRTPDMKDIETQ